MMAAPRRVRIADVAVQAGVGVGTVSRVLNRSPQVSNGTRQRVLEAIKATNYRPSRLAADLSRGTPTSVAILVPFLTRPSVVARLAGVIEALDAEGYDTIVCNVETPAQRDRQVHMLAAGHRAAGLVLISLRLAAGQLAALAAAGVPVAGVDVAARGLPHTVVDDVVGGMMAAQWSLSTVRQPLRESGTRGAVRLCQLLRGEAVRPLREVLPLELIVRGSTTAACGRRMADRAGPPRPEPAGSRSRLSLARAL